jgi:hypothetical protein
MWGKKALNTAIHYNHNVVLLHTEHKAASSEIILINLSKKSDKEGNMEVTGPAATYC